MATFNAKETKRIKELKDLIGNTSSEIEARGVQIQQLDDNTSFFERLMGAGDHAQASNMRTLVRKLRKKKSGLQSELATEQEELAANNMDIRLGVNRQTRSALV